MDLQKEQEKIKKIIREMSIEEFDNMLSECGNDVIIPTEEVYKEIYKD